MTVPNSPATKSLTTMKVVVIALIALWAIAQNAEANNGGNNKPRSVHGPVSSSSASSSKSNAAAATAARSVSASSARANGGSAQATGGNATASGGAGGSATAAGGAGVGNVEVSNSTSTKVRPPAYAPSMNPTVNCALTTSVGVGGVVSVGGSHVEENCARLEKAKYLASMGDHSAAFEVTCNDPEIRAARKRTGNLCMQDRPQQPGQPAQPSAKCEWMVDPQVRAREGCV